MDDNLKVKVLKFIVKGTEKMNFQIQDPNQVRVFPQKGQMGVRGSKNYLTPHFDFLTPMKKISDPPTEKRWGSDPHENMLISIKNWGQLT